MRCPFEPPIRASRRKGSIVRNIINRLFMGNKKYTEEDAAGVDPLPTPGVSDGAADTVPAAAGPMPAADEQTISAPLPALPEELPATTPLAAPPPSRAPRIHAVQRCHVGAVRPRNEDSALTFVGETGGQSPLLPFSMYIVADGMGGHFAGHDASRRVSRLVAAHLMQQIYLPLLREKDGVNQKPVQEIMLEAVQAANREIHNPDPFKETGTTLTAAVILGRRLYLAHVGDSRAYLLRDRALKLLTTDHSYVQRLQDAGQLTPEEAATHPQRNVLYRAVGQGGELEVDVSTSALPASGQLLLCSDGLWGLVAEDVITDVLEDAALSPDAKVDRLVELALRGGGHDNITAILVSFSLA